MFQQGGEAICLILGTFWIMKDMGLFLPRCSERILNVLAGGGWKCDSTPAIGSRTTSSQARTYTHCTSYSTVALACPNLTLSSSLRLKVQLAVPPSAPAVSLGSVLPLCCSLLQSASQGARAFGAHCQFWLCFLLFLSVTLPNLVSALTDGYYSHQS